MGEVSTLWVLKHDESEGLLRHDSELIIGAKAATSLSIELKIVIYFWLRSTMPESRTFTLVGMGWIVYVHHTRRRHFEFGSARLQQPSNVPRCLIGCYEVNRCSVQWTWTQPCSSISATALTLRARYGEERRTELIHLRA